MKLLHIIPLLALTLTLTACGGSSAASSTAPAAAPPAAGGAAVAPAQAGGDGLVQQEQSAAGGAAPAAGAPESSQNQIPFDRLVIKSADLSLEVERVTDAEAAIRAQVARLGGYVVKVENSGTDENLTTHITFRVPAARFDDALGGVQGLAKKVASRTISGDDVTEEFVDLDSRLRNLEATRDRLLTFLDKATRVEDALSVNNSLSEVQGQIEQAKGRMQYLKQNAALSTITVYLIPVAVTPIVPEGTWQPVEVARAALRSLLLLAQGLANVAIVLLVWTPLWLPLLLIGEWVRRRLARNRGTVSPVAPDGGAPNATRL